VLEQVDDLAVAVAPDPPEVVIGGEASSRRVRVTVRSTCACSSRLPLAEIMMC
jgi:hypothetical protein